MSGNKPCPFLEARELLSSWMISQGYATGHGDTIEDLLGELAGQINDERYKPKTEEVKAAWWKEESGRIFNKLCKAQDEIGRLRELNTALTGKLSRQAEQFDVQHGTPCEQIRHAQEVETLRDDIARKDEALKPFAGHCEYLDNPRSGWSDSDEIECHSTNGYLLFRMTVGDFRSARAALQPSDSIGKSVESFEKEAWALHLACIKALGVLGSPNDKIAILERHDLVPTEETVTALRSALHLHREACKRALSDKGGES